MIKIEFKERKFAYDIGNGLFYITKNRPQAIYMPSRSEILKQLGISSEEDELFQQQYKNV